jgi:hypothetical protein
MAQKENQTLFQYIDQYFIIIYNFCTKACSFSEYTTR